MLHVLMPIRRTHVFNEAYTYVNHSEKQNANSAGLIRTLASLSRWRV